jgi:DnaJ like chaperone protein
MNFRDYLTQYPWFGKCVGMIFGFLMAGPFGAFFGLFLGNFFDKGLAQHFSKLHHSYHAEHEETIKLYFLKATFSAIGYVGKGYGRITETLIQHVKQIMKELDLTPAEQKLAQDFFREGKETTQISAYLFDFKAVTPTHMPLLKLSAEFIYRAAKIDTLTHAKISRINEVFYLLGLSPLHTQQRFYNDFFHDNPYQESRTNQNYSSRQSAENHYKSSIDEAYAILQVSPSANETEVKRKYRRLMSQFHPDKLIARKASASAIKAANEKTQTISRAYEQICKYRGW